ncbi:Bicupin, oxalate decarboxylase/oxidase [Aspergillus campestris IBT 28561]|uniref:Bicupin, oxalate decarboxylase/oxidase n=1 Tax=Aspergillus campestris (strain IBT 28561) TaxID=1392248 RepID=A0A2I1DHR3_ASPC2|nr:Bicupin, oxalate decarboxylase/oxidase [Aspergillus campestris IBT 28561]PKY09408.1 Bicupin, oxalate decarboxylase/oxidase [Aspergillus campestris IBT 28561]
MKASQLFGISLFATLSVASPAVGKRSGFKDGQPINGEGKGAPIYGGTNKPLDLQNPANLGQESTDNGWVPNLKWSFSDSKARIFPGGWSREQIVQDLPQSHDISGAQQHLSKGAIRELHWHRVAEWGFVYKGSILLTGVDENGQFTTEQLNYGDIWYFPKGVAHNVQGIEDENEYLLAFDDGDFEKVGTTFMVDDWINHTPKDILAKNFGVDASVFDTVPSKDPYILNGTVSKELDDAPQGTLKGASSYVYHTYDHDPEPVPGQGGTFRKIDSTNFPISKTLAAAVVELEPKGLRELHWHPNAEEWLYFHQGTARATVFLGDSKARTFDFRAGDTGVFPDNSGHYIENTSETEKLIWIEIYKSDRVADISLAQWLALTPADTVANTLKVDIEVVKQIKKEKQLLVKG